MKVVIRRTNRNLFGSSPAKHGGLGVINAQGFAGEPENMDRETGTRRKRESYQSPLRQGRASLPLLQIVKLTLQTIRFPTGWERFQSRREGFPT
jgi:hypothetical protein